MAEVNSKINVDYGLDDMQMVDPKGKMNEDSETSEEDKPKDDIAPKEKAHPNHIHAEVDVEHLDKFWQREARRMARNPCKYLLVSLVTSILISVIAMVVGEFSVSANTGGWESRGTLIADRQTQLMVIQEHQETLFTGDNAYWQELIDNVQPGWDIDDDDSGRRLASSMTERYEEAVEAEFLVDHDQRWTQER